MGKELFETLPDVLDAKMLASALSISKAGAYQLLNLPDFPTLQVGGRKLVTNQCTYRQCGELGIALIKI